MEKSTKEQLIILGIAIISLISAILVYCLPIKEDRGMLLGVLTSSFAGASAYFYKTSMSSAKKDETIKKSIDENRS